MKVTKFFLIIFLLTGISANYNLWGQEISTDSIQSKSKSSKNTFKDKIIKNAKDSINIDIINEKIHLYGNAEIEYGKIKINA